MASFLYYDLAFLILFSIGIALFLYKNRKKLQIESKIILLYRTKMGLDTIDYIAKRHPKFIAFLANFVIASGYLIMGASITLLCMIVYLMFKAAVLPKIPPLIPLVPYIDKALPTGLVPPFYFTYWIIVIAIVAVFHEFAHGVFAKIRNVRIQSTGFGFIGPLLAAFVEIDEKQMEKKPIKAQLAVLAAGSTANLILWVLFLAITAVFFSLTFVPNGLFFTSYMVEGVNLSDISLVNDYELSRNIESFDEFAAVVEKVNSTKIEVRANNRSYFTDQEKVMLQKRIIENSNADGKTIVLFTDSPAYRVNLSGAIQEISSDGEKYKVNSLEDLQSALDNFKAGDEIGIKTTVGNYTLTLEEHPEEKGKGFLGIAFSKAQERAISKFASAFSYKDPFIFYEPIGNPTNGGIVVFIYNMLYWIMIVNFFVMLFNMLPVGIVDGGRFFYLTMLGLTKSKKKAFVLFKLVTWLILIIFLAIMGVWFIKAF